MAKYNPTDQEKHWQQFWADNGIYHFHPESNKPVFSIDTPPPTVSGKLHMGHVFSYTQTEVLARYFRMSGHNLYYPFGMDDNGLPTERLVEQELGIRGSDTNRQEFIQKCLATVEKYHNKYRSLWQSLGFGVDWRLEYSTISPEVRILTQKNFIKLYQQKAIYRQKSSALWCWNCQTAVAQAEVEDKQFDTIFYDLVFQLASGKEILIATTRPELLSACVAVFVNPDDSRYHHLIGSTIKTPIGDVIKIYADSKVKIDKGTGIVMCCTYGDETDLYWKKQYLLDEKIILNKNGCFNSLALSQMQGLTIKEGRQVMVDFLKSNNLIRGELPIVHDVGCHERCSTPIEIINTDQWFVKVLDIKDQILKLNQQITWRPKSMNSRFIAWVENLKWDWAISRDRFYGIPIPIFYCQSCGEIVLPDNSELPIDPSSQTTKAKCSKCKSSTILGEHLVLDTWFTSSNTPEINVCLNLELTKGKVSLPMSLRPNAHDIIRTWDFYTIVLAYYKYGQIPWKDIAISGHILLRKGEKISKRTGGGDLRPEDQIQNHSADAIRFAMCSAALGSDGYYDASEVEMGKKLVNKLFNASNFVFSALKDFNPKNPVLKSLKPEAFDLWLSLSLGNATLEMSKYFTNYDYSHARDIFIKFFWERFCDYYLEIIKKRIYDLDQNDPKKLSAQFTLFNALLNILKMAAPFLPHITEELYQSYYRQNLPSAPPSIHLTDWPQAKTEITKTFYIAEEMIVLISLVRAQKAKSGLGLSQEVGLITLNHPTLTLSDLAPYIDDFKAVTRAKDIKISPSKVIEILLTTL